MGVAVDAMLQHSFRGFLARPFLYDRTLSPHIVFFMYVLLKTYRHLLQGSHSSSAFTLEKDVNSSSHHSCGPGAPFEPSLRPSGSDTNPAGVPASSCVPALLSQAQPSGWHPQHIPVPREVLAQSWVCPQLSYSLAGKVRLCPAPWGAPTACASQGAAGPPATIAWHVLVLI